MENHRQLSDSEFEQQFANASLPEADFSHEAHLRLAWIHIRKYELEKAISNIVSQLKSYVVIIGAEHIYHETLTIAAVRVMHHFILKSSADNFSDFISQTPRLKQNFRELIAAHYKTDIFNSELAKREYLEPDLLPFE